MATLSEAEVQSIDIDDLLLDWANPRIPANEHDPERSQSDLARLMDKRYNPLAVARSIADHGYFSSEPLIATRHGSKYRVLEGNRRLTALMGLRDEKLRSLLAKENRGWALLRTGLVPDAVPVLVVDREEDVDALLGFRHISGIDPWSPFQQAQFIAKLVDERSLPLEEVAVVVGRPLTEVRSMYRDFDVLRAGHELDIDVASARNQFGVFTAAMGRPVVRSFIGAPDPRNVDPDFEPFNTDNPEALDELLGFLFGRPGEPRVINESRQITDLVKVLDDESGNALEELRASRSLDEALSVLGGAHDALATAISLANRHLRRALDRSDHVFSEGAIAELSAAKDLVDALNAKLEEDR